MSPLKCALRSLWWCEGGSRPVSCAGLIYSPLGAKRKHEEVSAWPNVDTRCRCRFEFYRESGRSNRSGTANQEQKYCFTIKTHKSIYPCCMSANSKEKLTGSCHQDKHITWIPSELQIDLLFWPKSSNVWKIFQNRTHFQLGLKCNRKTKTR